MTTTAVPIPPTKRGILILIWAGVALAIAIAAWLAFQGTASAIATNPESTNAQFLVYNKGRTGVVETASGLQYQIIKRGTGDVQPTDTDVALIQYNGTLRDGRVFDASKQPTPLPVNGAVKGFSEALKLMHKGAKFKIWLKPELAYGENTPDPVKIPPGSLLIFDLELLDFLPEAVLRQAQMQQQMQQMQQQRGGAPGGPPPGALPPGALPPGAGAPPAMPSGPPSDPPSGP